MYSMVLMVAMTAAPDTTGFNGLFSRGSSCHGSSCSGSGCSGSSCYGSCTGYSSGCSGSYSGGPSYYGTTWGQSSYSCSGYGIYGGGVMTAPSVGYNSAFPGSSCSGSCSGCCGSSSNSCYGSGYGATPYSSCSGYGIYGGGTSLYVPSSPSAYGIIQSYPSTTPQSVTPPTMDSKIPMMPRIEDKKDTSEKRLLAPTTRQATVTVNLPADAKLFAQGQLTQLTSARREFLTPSLDGNEDYRYSLEVEYTRDGQTRRDSKTLIVRAGQNFSVDFAELPTAKMERISSRVEVILPADAKLFVNGSERVMTPGVREFVTPELAKGEEYVYRFRAEVVRDGRPESSTQIVSFKAGDPLRVDFSAASVNRLTSR